VEILFRLDIANNGVSFENTLQVVGGITGNLPELSRLRVQVDPGTFSSGPIPFGGVSIKTTGRSQVQINREIGNVARDNIAARSPGAQKEAFFDTSLGARRLDVLTTPGLAIESKVGRTSLTSTVRRQIQKDIELFNTARSPVNSLQFQFTRSPITNKVGPTRPLADFLQQNNIPFIIND